MDSAWSVLLNDKNLSSEEKILCERFYKGMSQGSFLGFAKLLKRYGYEDEALEVLSLGVKRFPSYHTLRIQLAQDLFLRGLIEESYNCLSVIADAIREHPIALPLLFQLAVLLRKDGLAHATYLQLKEGEKNLRKFPQGFDSFSRLGVLQAREEILLYLRNLGVQLILPESDANAPLSNIKFLSPSLLGLKERVAGFYAVSLDAVFHDRINNPSEDLQGIPIETRTIAEIYEKQKHYLKALDIYRHLLRKAPMNDHLRMKVSELSELVERL